MKVIAINGSPRTNWNTAQMLESALKGAAAHGAETELINLYSLNFKGCTSCFACKLAGKPSYGKCALRDELAPVLEKIAQADAVILGSPIYFGMVTGEMRSFLERLWFPYLTYMKNRKPLFKGKLPTAFIYTMNVSEDRCKEMYNEVIAYNASLLGDIFGPTEALCSHETLQFPDYGKVEFDYANPEYLRERHKTVFPQDLKKAFELGERLTQKAASR